MPSFHLNCAKVLVDEVEIGAQFAGTLTQTVDDLDATAFCDTFMVRQGGLEATDLTGQYYYDTAVNDTPLYSRLGTSDTLVLVVPKLEDGVGAVTYQFTGMHPEVTGPEGDTGSLAGGSFQIAGTSLAVRGRLLETGETARTSTFDGGGVQLGAVASGETLYARLHVTSVSGTTPTLDVDIESDDNAGFTTPATVGSFTQATAVGAQEITVAGPLTDDYFRIEATIGGTDPSFNFYVTIGAR